MWLLTSRNGPDFGIFSRPMNLTCSKRLLTASTFIALNTAKVSQFFLSFNCFFMMPPGIVDRESAERLDRCQSPRPAQHLQYGRQVHRGCRSVTVQIPSSSASQSTPPRQSDRGSQRQPERLLGDAA